MEPLKTGATKGVSVKDLDGMLDEVYEELGWDKETGKPTKEKLQELGLGDAAAAIWQS